MYLARLRGTCELVVVKCIDKDRAPHSIQQQVGSPPGPVPSRWRCRRNRPLRSLATIGAQVDLEARLHHRLLHPHIVRCHAYLEDVPHKYLVLEYGDQGDLRKALHTFSEEQLRDGVVKPLLQALHALQTVSWLDEQGVDP